MAIQWGYHFVTGLRNVDRQHESLVALVNKLEAAMTEVSMAHEVERTFRELTDYAREHFALEEQLMDEAGVDDNMIAAHKNAHTTFVNQLSAMWQARDSGPETTTRNLLEFLTTWIYRHILISDHEMARDYYQKKGLTAPPSLLLTTSGPG
jgi:hemerythrin-like metal-binding protein